MAREYLAKRVGKSCNGRYLPVEVQVVNTYAKGISLVPVMGKCLRAKSPFEEFEHGAVEPEVVFLSCHFVHKLRETWDG